MENIEFEQKIKASLLECGLKSGFPLCIGVAVSGGADSISLMNALCSIVKNEPLWKLKVLTVNHNIRSEEESGGDASFVEDFCKKLGVSCTRFNLEKGIVFKTAKEKKCGVESSARELRYKCFEKFIQDEKIDFLCLAHNKNDQCETVLMRLFQGGNSQGLSGIPLKREKIIRPLLQISRNEIVAYLKNKNISWREDSTNSDTKMYRNKIRTFVTPVLNQEIPDWASGVSLSVKKLSLENDFLEKATLSAIAELEKKNAEISSDGKKISVKDKKEFSYDKNMFFSFHKAIQMRILYKTIEKIGAKKRISYQFLEKFLEDAFLSENLKISSGGIDFASNKTALIFFAQQKVATGEAFFVTICKDEVLNIADGTLCVSNKNGGIELKYFLEEREFCLFLKNLIFPFAFRSFSPYDFVFSSEGSERSVSKIFDSWKCGAFKEKIPVIQELVPGEKSGKQEILCIWGEIYGYKNWIVKEGR